MTREVWALIEREDDGYVWRLAFASSCDRICGGRRYATVAAAHQAMTRWIAQYLRADAITIRRP